MIMTQRAAASPYVSNSGCKKKEMKYGVERNPKGTRKRNDVSKTILSA